MTLSRRHPAHLLALALLATLPACSSGVPTAASGARASAGSAPGVVIVTAGGTALDDGAVDVPPTLDLRVSADVPLTPAIVAATLDGAPLPLRAEGDGVSAAVPAMVLASAHALVLHVPGRDDEHIGFRVVAAGEAFVAEHVDSGGAAVLDLALSLAPSDPAQILAGLPAGGRAAWSDARHLRDSWLTAPSGSVRLPAGLPLDRGSRLGATLQLGLAPVPAAGSLRTALAAAPAQPPSAPLVVGFSVPTAASRASVAAHAGQLSLLSPSGLTTGSDGSLDGAPDAPAVASARAAGVPVWPLLQNAGFDADAVHQLLNATAAEQRLVAGLRAAAAEGGWGGVHLDLENVAETDRDALTSLVAALAGALHADGRKLAVAVVPHRPGHENPVNAAYDLAAIGRAADLVTLMAYEQHSPSTDPGPVAGLGWDSQIVDGSAGEVGAPGRTLLGVPLYARVWADGGDDYADSYASALSAALTRPGGARVDYDFVEATPSIAPAAGGLPVTWFDDAASLGRKLGLAAARGLVGIAAWRLGFEDPAFWSLLPAKAARL